MATAELRTVDDPKQGASPTEVPVRSFPPHRVTVDRYERMVEQGIFGEDEPIFLWKGQLVEKMTKGHRHNNTLAAMNTALVPVIPIGWHLRPAQPAILGDDTEPAPDFIVVRGAIRDYEGRVPSARDVALIIEIADSSLAVDSGEVLEKYAQEKIPCYWLVNIPDRRIEMFTHPEGLRYREHRTYASGEAIPIILDGQEVGRIAVGDVLF